MASYKEKRPRKDVPFFAIAETSSLGRLAKLPGLVLPVEDMVVKVLNKLESE